MLEDRRDPVVLAAVEILRRLGSTRPIPQLVPLLDDDNPQIRQAAWRALIELSGRSRPLERLAWARAVATGFAE